MVSRIARRLRSLVWSNYGRTTWLAVGGVIVALAALLLGFLESRGDSHSVAGFWATAGLGTVLLALSLVTGALGNELHQRIKNHWPENLEEMWRNGALTRLTGKSIAMALVKADVPDRCRGQLESIVSKTPKSWLALDVGRRVRILGSADPRGLVKFIRDPKATAIDPAEFTAFISELAENGPPDPALANAAVQSVNALFGSALRECLKRDFVHGGDGWAAMCLDLSADVIRRVEELHSELGLSSAEIREDLAALHRQLDHMLLDVIDEFEGKLSAHGEAVFQKLSSMQESVKRLIRVEGRRVESVTREMLGEVRQLLTRGLITTDEFAAEYWDGAADPALRPLWDHAGCARVLRRSVVARVVELNLFSKFLSSEADHVLFVKGDPGVGKTRLMLAMAESAAAEGWDIRFVAPPVPDLEAAVREIGSQRLLLVWDDFRGENQSELLDAFLRVERGAKRLIGSWPVQESEILKVAASRKAHVQTLALQPASAVPDRQLWAEHLREIASARGSPLVAETAMHIVSVSDGNPHVMLHGLAITLSGKDIFKSYEPWAVLGASYGALLEHDNLDPDEWDALRFMAMLGDAASSAIPRRFDRSLERLARLGLIEIRPELIRMGPDLLCFYVIRETCSGMRFPAVRGHGALVDLASGIAPRLWPTVLYRLSLALVGTDAGRHITGDLVMRWTESAVGNQRRQEFLSIYLRALFDTERDDLAPGDPSGRWLLHRQELVDSFARLCEIVADSPSGAGKASIGSNLRDVSRSLHRRGVRAGESLAVAGDVCSFRERFALDEESTGDLEGTEAECLLDALEQEEGVESRSVIVRRIWEIADRPRSDPWTHFGARACLCAWAHESGIQRDTIIQRATHFRDVESGWSDVAAADYEVLQELVSGRDPIDREARQRMKRATCLPWVWAGARWAERAPIDADACVEELLDRQGRSPEVAAWVLYGAFSRGWVADRDRFLLAARRLHSLHGPSVDLARILLNQFCSPTTSLMPEDSVFRAPSREIVHGRLEQCLSEIRGRCDEQPGVRASEVLEFLREWEESRSAE